VVATNGGNHSPTGNVFTGVAVTGGLTPLELLYWDQGGQAQLKIEFKVSGSADSTYQVLGGSNTPLFSDANAPTLSETQDIISNGSGGYLIRSGHTVDGGVGDDNITGSAGHDKLIGNVGNDTLTAGAGGAILIGGAGNDTLNGFNGAHDVFRWQLGDAGPAGTPAKDVVNNFDNASYSGDALDLRDLLVGESHSANTVSLPGSIGATNAVTINSSVGNLGNYLHFSTSNGNTVIEISSNGGFSGGYSAGAVDQVIQINGVNLTTGFSSDSQIIADLLKRGKLITD
jgi:Ca2+-binding RTX toxin-like protein